MCVCDCVSYRFEHGNVIFLSIQETPITAHTIVVVTSVTPPSGDAMCSAKTVTFGGVVAYPKAPATGTIEQTKARFNCIGTLRDSLKMVGSNGSKFLTVRLVRSKLRKREETATAVAAAATAAATAVATANTAINNNNNNNNVDCQLPHAQPVDVAVVTNVSGDVGDAPVPLPFLWQYSAKNAAAKNTNGYNSPYRLYSSDQVIKSSLLFVGFYYIGYYLLFVTYIRFNPNDKVGIKSGH